LPLPITVCAIRKAASGVRIAWLQQFIINHLKKESYHEPG
jgi:hypothetical protein